MVSAATRFVVDGCTGTTSRGKEVGEMDAVEADCCELWPRGLDCDEGTTADVWIDSVEKEDCRRVLLLVVDAAELEFVYCMPSCRPRMARG